uniref:Endonuclease/exonuclease/phosphatase domain-containing protein n=1 Tax=Branchiostoma floridae TaxID=7739 RepID=C3Z1P3_BRAFL|eukprot:XP_002597398.1 hypothetical protein BRAFLDRAFT_69317 [Branchiostoma floridae]
MQDSDESDRPQRRTALVARELAKLDIDIAAISEVRFAEQGSLTEHGAGYTLYWSGKGRDERRLSGVGFMIKNSIANKLQNLPVGHSDRLMSLRLPLQDNQSVTLISVYAPTLQADPATKETFYTELRSLLANPPVKRKGPQMKRLQVDRLHGLKEKFQDKLSERLNRDEDKWQTEDPENQWQQLKTVLQETAAEVVGNSSRKNRDWFDENDSSIDALLQSKRSCYQRTLSKPDDPPTKAAYREACNTLQRKLREMQNKWWTDMAEKIQYFADTVKRQ